MNDIRLQLEKLIETIELASIKVSEGYVIELPTLQAEVEALCARVIKAEPHDARSMQPLMADLISRLDELAEHLEDFKSKKQEG